MSLKARDVQGHLKAHGYEKGTELMFKVLAEEQGAMRESIAQLAEMMNQLSDIIVQVTQIGEHQADAITKVQKTLGHHDDKPTTRDGH